MNFGHTSAGVYLFSDGVFYKFPAERDNHISRKRFGDAYIPPCGRGGGSDPLPSRRAEYKRSTLPYPFILVLRG